jgi:hypothetical protein
LKPAQGVGASIGPHAVVEHVVNFKAGGPPAAPDLESPVQGRAAELGDGR